MTGFSALSPSWISSKLVISKGRIVLPLVITGLLRCGLAYLASQFAQLEQLGTLLLSFALVCCVGLSAAGRSPAAPVLPVVAPPGAEVLDPEIPDKV
jgi:hypothetical protein